MSNSVGLPFKHFELAFMMHIWYDSGYAFKIHEF